MASKKKQSDLESQKPASASAVAAPVSESGETISNDPRRRTSEPETEPLLAPPTGDDDKDGGGAGGGVMARAFRTTADLAKLLPAGTVLVFEVLSPVFTNSGRCADVNRAMTSWLVGLCAAACFLLCFTDSFLDARGTVRYVVATRSGLWVIDGTPPPEVAANYRLKFIDFFHAVLSLVVFLSVAVFDRNVAACFGPVLSPDMRQVANAVPLAGGLVGGLLFATFPSTRHGVGLPIPVA